MSAVIKTAIGVFIGILLAYLAIKAPTWIHEHRQKAVAEIAAHKEFDVQLFIMSLTPTAVISYCGNPLKEMSRDIPATPSSPRFTLRRLRYTAATGNVELWFAVDQKLVAYSTYPDYDSPNYFGDVNPLVGLLPCLDNSIK